MVITTAYQVVDVGSIPANRSTTIRTNNRSRLYAKIQKTFTSNTRELQTKV